MRFVPRRFLLTCRFLSRPRVGLRREAGAKPLGPSSDAHQLARIAESLFAGGPRWEHVLRRKDDKWPRPTGASEDHLRFMAVVMETWCIADPDSVRAAWKLTGHEVAPPQRPEGIAKDEVYKRLSTLTRGRWTEKTKGLSFELVRALNPRTLQAMCPEFKALCDRLRELSSEQSS